MTPNTVVSVLSFPEREAQAFPLVPYRLLPIGKMPLGAATRRPIFNLLRFFGILQYTKYNMLMARESIVHVLYTPVYVVQATSFVPGI